MERRRLCLVVAVLAAGGCAVLPGPRSIEISAAELQQRVARRFPWRGRVLELIDVTLSAPQVTLRPDANRIATGFDLQASDRLVGRVWRGELALDHGLRFEPSDRSVRLAQVQLVSLRIDGAPPLLQRQLDRIGAWLAERMLEDETVHTLREADRLALERRGLKPGALTVTPRGIALALDPVD